MTFPPDSNENYSIAQPLRASNRQFFSVEVIRALTPIFLALIGGMIGMAVLLTTSSEAGFGLASTAIAGAAGLAQPYRAQKKKDD